MSLVHPDRLFSSDPKQRDCARELYQTVKDLPILSPHGHTDPEWFAGNQNFSNATELFILPDHYLLRMLYSQGLTMEQLGLRPNDGGEYENDPAKVWRIFAKNYHLFRATPTGFWLNHVFAEVFGFDEPLREDNAGYYFDKINKDLASEEFRPRSLFDRFGIEVISTTDAPVDSLEHHIHIIESDWNGRVIPCFRPDPVMDPEYEGFAKGIKKLGEITGEDTSSYKGYIKALEDRRRVFKKLGATSTDHGHPTAETHDISEKKAKKLFSKALKGKLDAAEAGVFRGHMLMEMARMSLEDGLVMQLHPGSFRNHNQRLFERFGRDKGADIPAQAEFVNNLKPLLDKYGNESSLTLILFTLDETTYSRELAPLAGHYPSLRIGPSWWFHDSPEGMRRYREQVTETAGLYNTVGFNDDTRAFLSIPARHDVARRMDCAMLAQWVCEHRLSLNDAHEAAKDLAYNLAKKAYKL